MENCKAWSLKYANNIVSITNEEGEMKAKIKSPEHFLEKKFERRKVQDNYLQRRRKTKTNWQWKGEKIEEVS